MGLGWRGKLGWGLVGGGALLAGAALLTRRRRVPFGLWIDNSAPVVATAAFWDEVAALGVEVAAIMVESSRLGWDRLHSRAQLESAIGHARARDIAVVLTTWPSPTPRALDAQATEMDELLSLGVIGWEVDLEGGWLPSKVGGGFSGLEEASAVLVEIMHRARERHDVRLEVTTHTGHRESKPAAWVTPFVDRLNLQLYATRLDWRDEEVPWGSRNGPGRRQAWGIDQALQIPAIQDGRVSLGVGLALWRQAWPGHSVAEALSQSYQASAVQPSVEVRGWSSKYVTRGARYSEEVAQWLQTNIKRPLRKKRY